jgi:uncharacterized membrane protein
LTHSSVHPKGWHPGAVFGPGVAGKVAIAGTVVAGAAIVEAALIPGLLIGGAAILAPRLLRRDVLGGAGSRLRRTMLPRCAAPTASAAPVPAAQQPAPFDAWRAVVKTLTYRAIVTTVDFGANYFVIGEFATAAGLSSLSLVTGPIAYFAHEAAWHYCGPVSARHVNPLQAAVHVPIRGPAKGEDNAPTRFAGLKISRALAKTVTYEGVTGVSEFAVNYLFVRDLAAATGLTAFSVIIAPIVYYVHEKAWDYYDAAKARSPAAASMKRLPTTQKQALPAT